MKFVRQANAWEWTLGTESFMEFKMTGINIFVYFY